MFFFKQSALAFVRFDFLAVFFTVSEQYRFFALLSSLLLYFRAQLLCQQAQLLTKPFSTPSLSPSFKNL